MKPIAWMTKDGTGIATDAWKNSEAGRESEREFDIPLYDMRTQADARPVAWIDQANGKKFINAQPEVIEGFDVGDRLFAVPRTAPPAEAAGVGLSDKERDAVEQAIEFAADAHDVETVAHLNTILSRATAADGEASESSKSAHEIVAEQQRTHEFVQFADRTRYVASIDPKRGIKQYTEAAQQQAEPILVDEDWNPVDRQQPEPGTDEHLIPQFLTDVLTAAGLVSYGKQSKALAERLSDGAMKFRAAWAAQFGQRAPADQLAKILADVERALPGYGPGKPANFPALPDRVKEVLSGQRAGVAEDGPHAGLIDALMEACRVLPQGYSIELRVENGWGGVQLLHPYGNSTDYDDGVASLAEQVRDAMQGAMLAAAPTQQEGGKN